MSEQVNELSSIQSSETEKIKVSSAEIVVHGTMDKPYYEIEYFDLSDNRYHTGYSSYNLDFVFRWREERFEIVKVNEDSTISEQVNELRYKADTYNTVGSAWELNRAEAKKLHATLRKAADTIEVLSATLNKDEDRCRYKYAEIYHIGETVNKLHELCGEKIGWIHYGREIADSFQMINRLCSFIESPSSKLQAANMERPAEDSGGWIPCKERLPEENEFVLVAVQLSQNSFKEYETCCGYLMNGKWYTYTERDFFEVGEMHRTDKVSAWQPLPEPYHEP